MTCLTRPSNRIKTLESNATYEQDIYYQVTHAHTLVIGGDSFESSKRNLTRNCALAKWLQWLKTDSVQVPCKWTLFVILGVNTIFDWRKDIMLHLSLVFHSVQISVVVAVIHQLFALFFLWFCCYCFVTGQTGLFTFRWPALIICIVF